MYNGGGESMEEVLQAISTIGFPIVSFLICAYFIKYAYDKQQEQTSKSMDKIGSLADAVNSNSQAILALTEEIREMKMEVLQKEN